MSLPIKGISYETYTALISRSTGQIQTSPTLAAGDVKVVKDGGAEANITTLPTESPASSGILKISLSATEMDADCVVVKFVDAAGAEWDDLVIPIETDGVLVGFEVDDAVVTSTTTTFGTSLTELTDDFYNDLFCVMISGDNAGQSRKITDYDGTNKQLTFTTAWSNIPADGDKGVILGRSA